MLKSVKKNNLDIVGRVPVPVRLKETGTSNRAQDQARQKFFYFSRIKKKFVA
jgi:hypothetical protein